MSDANNNSGLPEQDQEYTAGDTSAQSKELYSGSENGSTYWESDQIQNTYDNEAQQPASTQADNNQNDNDLAFDNFKQNQYELQQKKKSRKKPIFATLIIVILLLAGAATAYAFNGTLKNSIDLFLKSPKDYYAHVENKSIGSSADKSIAYMNMSGTDKDIALDITAKLSYDKDTVGAMIQNYLGMTISDLEAVIGMPLDSIGFDIVAATKEKEIYEKIGVNLNSIDMITAELFIDYTAKEMLFHLPDLSPAYLRQSLDMSEYGAEDIDIEAFNEISKLLSSKSTAEFIKRYTALITDEINDVELSKGESLTVGDLTVESNVLTVHFNPDTLLNIFTRVLEESKSDKYIMDLLPLLSMTKEEYDSKIDDALEHVKNSFKEMDPESEPIVMNVYVGNDGSIQGRKLIFKDLLQDRHTISLFNVKQKDKGAYEFNFTEHINDNNINVTGSHTIDDGAYTGAAAFTVSGSGMQDVNFDIEYENVKTAIKNNRLYTYGNINLSSYVFMGMELALEYDVKDDKQLAAIKLNLGKSSIVTLDISTEYLDDFKIPEPNANADYYDTLTESEAYASSINIQEYISELSNRFGVDLESLLGSFLPIY
jgi:hypothetical protein